MPYRKSGMPIDFQRLGEIADELDKAEAESAKADKDTSATLSIEASKKVHELLGNAYETKRKWVEMTTDSQWDNFSSRDARILPDRLTKIGAPDFGETVRILPKIAKEKKWPWISNCIGKLTMGKVAEDCLWLFMGAPTEEEGMAKVSEYLEKIL